VTSPELRRFFDSTVERLSETGVSVDEVRELPYGLQLLLSGHKASCKVNLYYSKKKGNSIVQAGGDRHLLDIVLGDSFVASVKEPAMKVQSGYRAGSDEAGKGDYFGPLVVAAVACSYDTAKALRAMGAADSKKLSRVKVRALYEAITVMEGVRYSVYSIVPREYNRLFDSFRTQGRNSLDMLAMAHGKALGNLVLEDREPDRFVVDKFCSLERLKPWLTVPAQNVELRERAEDSEPAVAAASIIARSVFLDELNRLSSLYKVQLKPGSGASSDSLGRELVLLHGEGVLVDTVKLHFANTNRVKGQDLTGKHIL
jgi:ribonuclease HIII